MLLRPKLLLQIPIKHTKPQKLEEIVDLQIDFKEP